MIGSSKQNAKTEAAKEGLLTLITNPKFSADRMAIIASVQRSKLKVMNKAKINSLWPTISQ